MVQLVKHLLYKLHPQNSCKEPGVAAPICNPSTGKAKLGDQWSSVTRKHRQAGELPVQ